MSTRDQNEQNSRETLLGNIGTESRNSKYGRISETAQANIEIHEKK